MNDTIREKLSAYLDGALSDQERRAVEVEISRSEEMRLELEALRAVSGAVKGMPKEKLPDGFMARLEARRARENSKPQRDYFILPPSYRPLAFALSTAVVALVVWDRTHTPTEFVSPRAGWDSEKVAVKNAVDAPPSIDVSGQVAALGEQARSLEDTLQSAKKEDSGDKAAASSTFGKHISAPGKPLEIAEMDAASLSGAGGAKLAAPTAPAAALDQLEPAEGSKGVFLARNEEERSAINERLYKGFEEEKKRMGITSIMDKDAEPENLPTGGRELMTLQASPEAARVDGGRPVAAARGAKAKRQSAPIVKALTLKSSEALQAAWAAAGLPGEPPAVSFPDQMAIFLTGPQGCGIVEIQNRKKLIVVLYKNAGMDDAATRVRAVALSPKPVVIKLAE
jgi:hypothetical protein